MKNLLRTTLLILLTLSAPAQASEYVSNFVSIPAVTGGPVRIAEWSTNPTVIVCENAPISEPRAAKAVKFWRDLGHSFFTSQYKYDPLGKCRQSSPKGYILIQLVTQEQLLDEDSLGVTHFYVDNNTNKVDWAVIYLKVGSIKETVLEHELGHALGYLHYDKINHLMNSKWTQGGWNTKGLAAK